MVIVALAGIFHKKIRQIYGASTLFDAAVIDENFRSADKTFPVKQVRRGGPVSGFRSRPGVLPETYVFRGQAKNLPQFIDKTGTTGMVVVKDDTILFEKYYRGNTEKTRAISWSVAKSFVSALIGVAVGEGYIRDIRQPITDYVP